MREINIELNDHNQRLDRFLFKYLDKAPRSFIFRMLRKKNIKLNGNRAKPSDMVKEGDKIELFLSDETINKFQEKVNFRKSKLNLDIIYEDKNILLVKKGQNVLSQPNGGNEENIVDGIISYLISKGEYSPKEENTFVPAIINRLDRNTSGIIIAGKNYQALKDLNESMRENFIDRYYTTIVKGQISNKIELMDYIKKNRNENKVYIDNDNKNGKNKKIVTKIKPLKTNEKFSLVEVDLITGRTHQIRLHLSSIGHPIIGDNKYGDRGLNKCLNLSEQVLHGGRIKFNNPKSSLRYLKGREFSTKMPEEMQTLVNKLL